MTIVYVFALAVSLAVFLFSFHRYQRASIPKNTQRTSKATILAQMNELRPLPMGMKEFDEWSDRILSGALIPSDNPENLKAVLASMIMALGPTEDHKPDAYFIHLLRKAAANEVASSVFQKTKLKRMEADEQKPNLAEVASKKQEVAK